MAHEEFSLIRRWTKRAKSHQGEGVSVGIGDDAAVVSFTPGREVVACSDAMIETVHFLRETMEPEDIGYKVLVSNISDIAAMGGVPRFALVTIGVSPAWTAAECERIYDGLYEAAALYGVQLIGGDTVATPDALHLSVTVLGEVESGKALLRSAATPGQLLFVTGQLGGSAAGLHVMLEAKKRGEVIPPRWHALLQRHRRPQAQVTAGRLLANSGGALNDISDGLASELWEIAEASGVRLVIRPEQVPLHPDAVAYAQQLIATDPLQWALFGGEEYQLVGTINRQAAVEVQERFHREGLSLTIIGYVEEGEPGVYTLDQDGNRQRLHKGGYNHFQSDKEIPEA